MILGNGTREEVHAEAERLAVTIVCKPGVILVHEMTRATMCGRKSQGSRNPAAAVRI